MLMYWQKALAHINICSDLWSLKGYFFKKNGSLGGQHIWIYTGNYEV